MALAHTDLSVILDESKGRTVAKRLGLKVTGTIGLIIKAKELGLIESGKQILDQLEQHGFWLSAQIRNQVLGRLKE